MKPDKDQVQKEDEDEDDEEVEEEQDEQKKQKKKKKKKEEEKKKKRSVCGLPPARPGPSTLHLLGRLCLHSVHTPITGHKYMYSVCTYNIYIYIYIYTYSYNICN